MIKLHADSDFITCSIVKWTKFSYKISCNLAITLFNKVNITTYFENLTVKLHVLYSLNTNVKFCVNKILFTI